MSSMPESPDSNCYARRLSGCIGCGCLSLERCAIYNRDDEAQNLGPGPRWLLGDEPAEPAEPHRLDVE